MNMKFNYYKVEFLIINNEGEKINKVEEIKVRCYSCPNDTKRVFVNKVEKLRCQFKKQYQYQLIFDNKDEIIKKSIIG